jgi:hypothetical protein
MTNIHVDNLDPSLQAVIDDPDLACIGDYDDQGEGSIDIGTLYHLHEYASVDLAIETAESPRWVQAAIAAHPGIWTARPCRAMHDLPETEASIIHCGRCACYANSKRRRRARRYAQMPLLPGFDTHPYQLHSPCSRRDLTWLRKLIYRLRDRDQIETRRERIPDCRQARGWDWATRIYPA